MRQLGPLGLGPLLASPVDTDMFGTFSRDIPRLDSQAETLIAKARAGLAAVPEADFAIASEGAFGPHPGFPFAAGGLELVGLVERDSGEAIIGRDLSPDTNFAHRVIADAPSAERFAADIGFPEHGLVAMTPDGGTILAKGLTELPAFRRLVRRALADHGALWLESDMRAHRNPTRMRAIGRAAADLATRLRARCPGCGFPDWIGRARHGRPCAWCRSPTLDGWSREYRCRRCGESACEHPDPERLAEPAHCPQCNP